MSLYFRLLSDAVLVRLALADRPGAFEALVFRYQRRAQAIIRAAGVPPDSLEDIVQEAFLQAFRGLRALRAPESFGPWFLAIARNLALKHHRISQRLEDAGPIDLDSLPDPRPDSSEARDLSETLWREVGKLPDGIREAIFLYYYEGQSIRTAAQALEISKTAVKSRLLRGRDLLRETLWRQLGEAVRGELPSPREWKRRGRRMALLLMAAGMPEAIEAGAAAAAPAAAAGRWFGFLGTGAWIMSAKQFIILVSLGAIFILGGWAAIRKLKMPSPAEGPDASVAAPPAAANPGFRNEPASDEAGAAAALPSPPATGIAGTIYFEESNLPAPAARVAAILDGAREHAKTTAAGADGRYLLAGLKPGKYHLWCWRDDWAMEMPDYEKEAVEVHDHELVENVNRFLARGMIITGQVFELATSTPVAGASVDFARLQFAGTGADGRFRLEGIPQGLHMVIARSPGYSTNWAEVDGVPGEEPFILLKLEPAGALEGTVLNPDGSPAGGTTVEARAGSAGGSGLTGADGRYRIDGIPLHAVSIPVTASIHGTFAAGVNFPGFEPGKTKAVVNLRLRRGFTFKGQVADGRGRPLEGAKIHLLGSMIFDEAYTTDSEGAFAIEGATERMFILSARKRGFAPAMLQLRDLPPEEREKLRLAWISTAGNLPKN